MYGKLIRSAFQYAFVLIAGLGIGYLLVNFKELTRPAYIEGDYSAYYSEAPTKVVVYGTQTCPFCAKARSFLNQNSISFVDYDIEKSEKSKKDFLQLGGEGVPVILIGNRLISGFDEKQINAALDISGIRKQKH